MSSIRQCANIKGTLLKYNNIYLYNYVTFIEIMNKSEIIFITIRVFTFQNY